MGVLTTGAGSGFQAAPAVQVKSFAGASYTPAFDTVIVATRNVGAGSTTNNRVLGLNGNTSATVWTFASGNMDTVNATPYIDYVNNFVWVTSRSNGGVAQPSVWKITTIGRGAVAASATFNLNNIDQAPTQNFDGRVIYVTTNGGQLYAVRTDINNCARTSGHSVSLQLVSQFPSRLPPCMMTRFSQPLPALRKFTLVIRLRLATRQFSLSRSWVGQIQQLRTPLL